MKPTTLSYVSDIAMLELPATSFPVIIDDCPVCPTTNDISIVRSDITGSEASIP